MDINKKFIEYCEKGKLDNLINLITQSNLKNDTHIDVNFKNNDGNTGFIWACYNGYIEIVELLLKNNNQLCINVNAINNNGYTGFILACKNGYKEIVELLLQNNNQFSIEVNAKDKYDDTGFIWACYNGNKEIVLSW